MSYPVYAKPLFSKAFANNIHAQLANLKWLNQPEEYLYNFNQLYDSPNHLLFYERDERSLKLLANIKQNIMIAKW